MRVLHVVESWRPVISGYTGRGWAILQAQAAHPDVQPFVLVSSRQYSYGTTTAQSTDLTAELVVPSNREHTIRRVYPHYIHRAHLARRISIFCQKYDIDIIHSHWSSEIGMAAAVAAKQIELPFLAEVRFDLAGAIATETVRASVPGVEGWLRQWLERHIAHADAVVAASYSLAKLLAVQFPSLADDIRVMPNGVDTRRFCPDGDDRRSELGLAGRFVIGTTSKMLRYEGLDRLLDILPRLTARLPDLAVLFIGDGPQMPELQGQAATAHLPVTFTGRVPPADVPAYLRTMDAFVVPRRDATVTRHASPIKVVEAMACGLPIVASAVGDIPDLLAEGRGLAVPPSNGDALVDAIERLATDNALRREMAQQIQVWAQSYPTWQQIAEQYHDLYASLR